MPETISYTKNEKSWKITVPHGFDHKNIQPPYAIFSLKHNMIDFLKRYEIPPSTPQCFSVAVINRGGSRVVRWLWWVRLCAAAVIGSPIKSADSPRADGAADTGQNRCSEKVLIWRRACLLTTHAPHYAVRTHPEHYCATHIPINPSYSLSIDVGTIHPVPQ